MSAFARVSLRGEGGLDALEQAVLTIDANDGIIFLTRSALMLLKGRRG